MHTSTQHVVMTTDRDRAQRIQGLTAALNGAIRDAANAGLTVEVGILSMEAVGHAHAVPMLTSRVAREVEVG